MGINMKWFAILLLVTSSISQAKILVAASTTDMEALVRAVGGNLVDTFAVAKGTQDPHAIEAKPSFMVKFRDADLVVSQGLELESAWLDSLVSGSRNPKIAKGTNGNLELGPLINPIEVVTGNVSRAGGDVHPLGNPHFQLDPIRMGWASVALADRLASIDAANADKFRQNAENYRKHLEEKTKVWQGRIKKTGIKEFVSYHKTLSYFADRFGLSNLLQLEPKPGIPPVASHTIDVINQMKLRHLKVVLIENYFDDSVKAKLRSEIPNVIVDKVAVSVGGEPAIKSLDDLIEALVVAFEKAAK